MILEAAQLRREMAFRGLDGQTLARLSGLSKNTITHALQGRPVLPRSLRKITSALLTCPVLRMAEELVAKPRIRPADTSDVSG
ncbi:MAG: hypothetical protein ABSG33_12315 [Candidatus Bathyarchaeia archaeon]|jgi:transcriptional regulator with XRE-family HTH domain